MPAKKTKKPVAAKAPQTPTSEVTPAPVADDSADLETAN